MKINRIIGLAFLILLFSISTYGTNSIEEVFQTEFISEGKFTVDGTINDPYNEGKYHIDEGVHAVYSYIVDLPQTITFTSGLLDDYGNTYPCIGPNNVSEITLSSANDTYYSHCDIIDSLNETGQYYYFIQTTGQDNNIYVLQKIKIIDAKWSSMMWVTLSLFIVFMLLSVYFKEGYLVVVAMMFLVGFTIFTCLVTYWYLFQFWGTGIVGIIAIIVLLLVKKLVDESFK